MAGIKLDLSTKSGLLTVAGIGAINSRSHRSNDLFSSDGAIEDRVPFGL